MVSLARVLSLDMTLKRHFLKIWGTKQDLNLLLLQLVEMKNKENEIVKEFDVKFEKLPNKLRPRKEHLLFLYINAFPRHFGFMLKDKNPKTLEEACEMVARFEANISSCKVEPFYAPRAKAKTKPIKLHNVEPTQEISAPWAQRIKEAINCLTHN
jgi:hypothetical protein